MAEMFEVDLSAAVQDMNNVDVNFDSSPIDRHLISECERRMKELKIRYDFGPVDSELISAFERKHGIALPRNFRELIGAHDALRPEANMFRFENKFSESYAWSYKILENMDSRDLTFLGFNENLPSSEKITWQDFDAYGHEHVIAFGIAANGDHVCFDYRHDPCTDEPNVVVMFHDAYDADDKMLICPVTNSFERFMDSLYKRED